ncbi:DUF1345 domain-containing protein [Microbacterium sp. zg.Y1090]|uniref:DUF1345 domain-containing protein n=1 Tax=Microbacterium TaxID=33882 RepID=UPI00214C2F97|nr:MULTISPECIES: DUF1345 domain-containing protein [unclassified Microbacterium]MCR2812126.1 DUF1345 domain-containing protein [Microbacterium sp. zg.Y1084]MCR2818436.1 DUF1345 domain-containing protein [Microbacterium sp. zg.Y1090]MDL5486249.1 DUF1345 domain-containing protein [Microbacterium sp. zg-Y1211]WIM29447.1 DUF1345 domain-containing protein [Microbacterium sp. zg-Y1090]
MQATRYVTDAARANLSSAIAAALGFAFAVATAAMRGDLGVVDPLRLGIDVYLFMWPSFGAVYLVWTHLAYSRHDVATLRWRTQRELQAQRRWWWPLVGFGGASSWTLSAALAAVFITVVIAQTPEYRGSLLYVALGLLCVACSWALMVYAFALQYLRLQVGTIDADHIRLEVGSPATFGDYLTLSILLSTMAATVSASVRTRQAWMLVRTNVLFAFTFNSVIVAMVVSLLLGGLSG